MDQDRLTQYLLLERPDEERAAIEDAFFEDDDLFYSLLELENDLTDQYAAGMLTASEKDRFASSLSKLPSRREKLSSSMAMRELARYEGVAERKDEQDEQDLLFSDQLVPAIGVGRMADEEPTVAAPPPQPPPSESSWQRFIRSLRANWQLVGLGAVSMILLAGIGIAIIGLAVITTVRGPDTNTSSTPPPFNGSTPPPIDSSTPRVNPVSMPPQLRPNTGSSPTELRIARSEKTIRFSLIVPADSSASPFNIMLDGKNAVVPTRSETRSNGETVLELTFEINNLKTGTHQITVTKAGGERSVYNFRLVRY